MATNLKCVNVNRQLRTRNGLVSLIGIASWNSMPQMYRVSSITDLPDFDKIKSRDRTFSPKSVDKYVLLSIKQAYLEIDEEINYELLEDVDNRLEDVKDNAHMAVGLHPNKFRELMSKVSYNITNTTLYDLQGDFKTKKSTFRVLVDPEFFPQDKRLNDIIVLYKPDIGLPLLIPSEPVAGYHPKYNLLDIMNKIKV